MINVTYNCHSFDLMKTEKLSIAAGAFFGLSGVLLGAMAAHALRGKLDADSMRSFETGVRFQLFHAILLLVLPPLEKYLGMTFTRRIAYLTIAGIVLFSFSIYLLTLAPLVSMDASIAGPVTPLGGLLLITAWAMILYSVLRKSV